MVRRSDDYSWPDRTRKERMLIEDYREALGQRHILWISGWHDRAVNSRSPSRSYTLRVTNTS